MELITINGKQYTLVPVLKDSRTSAPRMALATIPMQKGVNIYSKRQDYGFATIRKTQRPDRYKNICRLTIRKTIQVEPANLLQLLPDILLCN